MKILMLTNKLPYPVKDGGAYAMASMYNGYQQQGLTVKMLCMTTHKHSLQENTIPAHVELNTIPMNTKISPLALVINFLFSKKPYNYNRFYSQSFEKKLKLLLTEVEYDVVQLEGLYLGHYIPAIRAYSKAHIVLRAHNVEHTIWQGVARRETNWFKKYYFNVLSRRLKAIERDVINQVDSIMAISSEDVLYFEKQAQAPVFVSPTSFGKLSDDRAVKKTNAIFFMGSLDWIPNQDALWWFIQHVWRKIHKEMPDLKFYIAGRNCPKSFIKKINDPGIQFMGEVEHAPEFMRSHGIFVLPLFAGSGLRIRVIEAMSLGVPIVSSSLAVKGIACNSGENIIIANNSNEFYQGVKRLLHSNDLYESISMNAKTFVQEEFDQKRIMEGTVNFLKRIVA